MVDYGRQPKEAGITQGVGMLFGHHNNDVNQPAPDQGAPVQVSPTLNPLAVDPTTGVSLPVANDQATAAGPAAPAPEPSVLSQPAATDPGFAGMPLPPPPAPLTPPPAPTTAPMPALVPDIPIEPPAAPQPVAEPVPAEPQPEPVAPEPAPTLEPEPATEEPVMPLDDDPTPASGPADLAAEPVDLDNLLDLKQHALAELTPLVDKLEQTPEERFRTKMMMIQSSDDQSLIKDAYEAAMSITDEKNRAQALLDIVNEINYFTTPHDAQ